MSFKIRDQSLFF